MKTHYFCFEIYTCNEITGQTGWDIHFVCVKASEKAEAISLLKKYPNFDCIILFDFHMDYENETADFLQLDGHRSEKIIKRITL